MNNSAPLFAALAISLLATACSHKTDERSSNSPAIAVHTITVEPRPLQVTEPVLGTVQPKLRATLEAKVTGRIDKLPVIEGQPVKKGDLIAELDAREIRARLDQAIAARDQAERDLNRTQTLLRQGSATESEFDAVTNRVRSAVAAVVEAEAMLAYVKVAAPFDGVITRKWADVGDLAAPGKRLVELEDPGVLRFEADVPETLAGRIEQGRKYSVRIPAVGENLEGTVTEIAPAVTSDTRTLLVKLDLPHNEHLRSGLFGQVDIPVKERPSLRVPITSIVQRGQMEIAFVATNNTAQLRLVKTGKRFGDTVEILSGVESGDTIVTDKAAELIDGQPILRP